MKIEHESFILNIEEVLGVGDSLHYRVSCNELPYFPQGLYMTDLNTIITRFKLAVKSQTKADEVEKEIEEEFEYKGFVLKLGLVERYGTTEQGGYCEELNYRTFGKSREKDIEHFKSYLDNHPTGQYKAREKEKAMTQDTEVQLVNQFILDLNQVADEMEKVEKNNYYEVILEAKLLKLMKSYGESLCLGTMNVYRSHYKYILEQREKKEEDKKTIKYTVEYRELILLVEDLPDATRVANCKEIDFIYSGFYHSSFCGLVEDFKKKVNEHLDKKKKEEKKEEYTGIYFKCPKTGLS